MKKDHATFKFNGGKGALLCNRCRVILKTGDQFSEEEWDAMMGGEKIPAQYCKKCQLVSVLNDCDHPWTECIRTLGNEKHRVITILSPFPEPVLDYMQEDGVLLYGFAEPDGRSGVDFYIPM